MAMPQMEDVTADETIQSEIKDVLASYADIMPKLLHHKHYHLIESSITKLNSSPGSNP